jgi:hypothetical protein
MDEMAAPFEMDLHWRRSVRGKPRHARFFIGVVGALLGVAGGELLTPTAFEGKRQCSRVGGT